MIVCPKCGSQNMLGRVFCGACGAKLDLNAMTNAAVADMQRPTWFRAHIWKLVAALVVLALVPAGCSLVPRTGLIGKDGTPVGVQRVETNLRYMMDLKPGQRLGPVFRETDVNAYLDARMASKLGAESVRVAMYPSYMHMRIIKPFFSVSLFGFTFSPKTSYDVYCSSLGRGLIVRKVQKGRLTLVGPHKNSVVRRLYGQLSRENDWKAFSGASSLTIEIEEGQTRIALERR